MYGTRSQRLPADVVESPPTAGVHDAGRVDAGVVERPRRTEVEHRLLAEVADVQRVVGVEVHVADAAEAIGVEGGKVDAQGAGVELYRGRQVGVVLRPRPVAGRPIHAPELTPAHPDPSLSP